MSERKAGFYWVKYCGEWAAMEWYSGRGLIHQWLFGPESLEDEHLDEIGPRIPTPDEMEGWQLVPVEPTQAMLREAATSDGTEDEEEIGYAVASAAWDYHLMLAAAPRFGDDQ